VLLDDGALYGWGENLSGQIVHDTWWAKTTAPNRIIDVPCAMKASIGTVGIAIAPDGRAFTWGVESYGQRGDGPDTPTDVFTWLDLAGVTDVSSRRGAIAAATGSGAYGWGDIFVTADAPTALDVQARTISANVAASCLVSPAGEVLCWGNNQCGGGTCAIFPDDVVNAPAPIPIALSGPAVRVAIDVLTACALLDSGEVECWGSNAVSQIGRGVDGDALAGC
jgi:alpha-tubulin suppressor-like RCC1 family protein